MPLSDGGDAADGVFGATHYQTSYQPRREALIEDWFGIA
jgi:hypothetical protein